MNASMEQLRRADGALCYRAAEGKEWTDTTGHGPARQREAGDPVAADLQRRAAG